MALINCPECGRENVSNTAVACPNCGYGIREHFEKIANENKKDKIKICAKCGSIFGYPYSPSYINNDCLSCHIPIIEIDVDTDEWMKIHKPKGEKYNYSTEELQQNNKAINEYNAKIFEKYIEPLGQLDTSLTSYKLHMERYGRPTDDIEEVHQQIKEKALWELHEGRRKREEEAKPKCPNCGSTDLKKLSALDRSASAFMWGLGSNKIGKTYECRKCKSTF